MGRHHGPGAPYLTSSDDLLKKSCNYVTTIKRDATDALWTHVEPLHQTIVS